MKRKFDQHFNFTQTELTINNSKSLSETQVNEIIEELAHMKTVAISTSDKRGYACFEKEIVKFDTKKLVSQVI